MYAYELFEQIKSQAIQHKNNVGNRALFNIFNILYSDLRNVEYFSVDEAYNAVLGAFASVAANDGRVSKDEYEYFINASNAFSQLTYDEFFNMVAKYNKQEHRNRTIMYFDRIRSCEVAKEFVDFCIMVAVVDGNVALDEELFCESLCESLLNRFDR